MRQTGRTTNQMKEAPEGAIFIWVNAVLSYPKSLSKSLGREDLIIYSSKDLIYNNGKLNSINRPIILDHAFYEVNKGRYDLSKAFDYIDYHNKRVLG
jgi:hypothetical protein